SASVEAASALGTIATPFVQNDCCKYVHHRAYEQIMQLPYHRPGPPSLSIKHRKQYYKAHPKKYRHYVGKVGKTVGVSTSLFQDLQGQRKIERTYDRVAKPYSQFQPRSTQKQLFSANRAYFSADVLFG